MAIEIPPLIPDRPPMPNWGQGAASARTVVPADRLLAALGRLASNLPGAVLSALRGAAASGANVELIVPGDKSPLQLIVAGQRVGVSGPARDALLGAVGPSGNAASPREAFPQPALPPAPDAAAATRAVIVEAQVAGLRVQPLSLPGSGGAESVTQAGQGSAGPATATVVLRQPLTLTASGGASAAVLAPALASAVENSGLFLESHLAAWAHGQRSLQQVQAESHALLVDAVTGAQQDPQAWSAQRAASQIDALQQQAFALSGPAWPGQAFRLEIARDRGDRRATDASPPSAGPVTATLSMTLPKLGVISAKIRVAASTVGVQMESPDAAVLQRSLPALASAFDARGLTVAQLTVRGTSEASGDGA